MTTQPFDNLQPSLALTVVTLTSGIFPSGGGGGSASGDTLGFIYDFAGNFAPSGSLAAGGQLLSIANNNALFNLIGTTYGGDGVTSFALPNLQGQAVDGTGSGQVLGVETGSSTVTLTTAELPPPQGSDQSFSNFQLSLPLETLICTSGVFPSPGGNSGSAAFIGQIANFAGTFVPSGWTVADGRLLSIVSNTALFSVIGTTYGGDGVTTFALPNLQGSVAVGADATHPVGTVFGAGSTVLTTAELPPGGTPVTNDQPSVAVTYLIATSGIFPSQGGGSSFNSTTPTLGEITAFAGNFAPSGWALAKGQLLSIVNNTALFSVIGTMYGGDGITTFALPNLDGSTVIGADGTNYIVGATYGTDATTLTAAIPACYLRGTLILTERGGTAVEDLAIGDEVVTFCGAARSIKWIGRRAYDGRFVAANRAVLPIRIEAGALDDGAPARDLWVSPEHALYIGGVLVPAGLLVNGMTIRQVESVERLEYFHIELEMHDVILAEGTPAESFVDCDNRGMFQNGAEFTALYPDATPTPWEFCAPRLEEGSAELTAIRAALRERAEALGYRFTDDPDLHLLIAGEVVRGHAVEENFYSFAIPAGSGAIWLASRSAVPAEVEAASPDRRRLGVLVERIVLREDELRTEIGCGHASLRQGFHDRESGYRWTDGMARLPDELLRPFAGEVTIEVHLVKPGLRYPLAASTPEAARTSLRTPRARR